MFDFGKLGFFGKVRLLEFGILGNWDIVKVGFLVNGISVKRDFGKVVFGDSGVLRKRDIEKEGCWESWILQKWDFEKVVFGEGGIWKIVIMGLGKMGFAYHGK